MKKKNATPSAVRPAGPAPKKQVEITAQAMDFIFDQSPFVQTAFMDAIHRLESEGRLNAPLGEKVEGCDNLFEIRVRSRDGQFRTFYCYAVGNRIYILSGFVKKTQKTPRSEIRKALKIKKELGL